MSGEEGVRRSRSSSGWWVFWTIVGFFGLVIAVNAVFMWLAVGTHSGTAEDAAYEAGLSYNERLAAAEEEAALGWTLEIDARRDAAGQGEVVIKVADASGAPLAGAEVEGRLVRPVAKGHDLSLDFTDLGGGRYRATPRIALPGQWELRILVKRGAETLRRTERLNL